MLTQNAKAFRNARPTYPRCAYRGVYGLKCAAGCLIPDEEYSPEMEGSSWKAMPPPFITPKIHSELIYSLQRVHDHVAVEDWRDILISTATHNNLSLTIFDSLPIPNSTTIQKD